MSEHYVSIQGEGPGVGQPTQFVRFAGCNLKCPAWPCDTQHAIDPMLYRQDWYTVTVDELLKGIRIKDVKRVTLTGGEPLLQPKEDLQTLVHTLREEGYEVELFTNGTFPFPAWTRFEDVTIIMDWKLKGSGEEFRHQWQNTRLNNLCDLKAEKDAIKFVCADEEDFKQACRVYDNQIYMKYEYNYQPHVYVGAVWGKVSEATVAEWILDQYRPFKLNVQLHNYIWPAHERAR